MVWSGRNILIGILKLYRCAYDPFPTEILQPIATESLTNCLMLPIKLINRELYFI